MAQLMLPSYLCQLLPSDAKFNSTRSRSIVINSGSWPELTREMRQRFPGLATRVLTEHGRLASGFALVVNDEIANADYTSLHMGSADEIAIIVSIAGG